MRFFSALLLLIATLGTGCLTTDSDGSGAASGSAKSGQETSRGNSDILRVGDKLVITLLDIPTTGGGPLQIEQTVGEDGFITLHLDVRVKAADKTLSQLQDDIRKEYVPRLYHRMSVAVRSSERYIYVGGEVRAPSRVQFSSDLTVLKAIKSAGDFTDFAKKSQIILTRTDGRVQKVDGDKAAKNPKLDLPVLPGDQIKVERRIF